MGISLSCPFAAYTDLDNDFESVILKSITFGDDISSFNAQKSDPMIMHLMDSAPSSEEKSEREEMENGFPSCEMLTLDPMNPKHEAAIKLQKVYKSFRTRRKLADCAVLIEQSWKLLDFAELKHSSISFFHLEKHETAISRWARARTRAAKVGKGLSKNGKAQKLALQHWLEAIDPRHRYGHNLHFYYVKWLHSQSKEPFFYWLDVGEGKEVNLIDKCPRSKLQQQCIKYLGPMERKAYEVEVQDGKLLYKQTGEFLDTTQEEPKGSKWIFVLSTSRTLYVGKKKKGTFQHSSFLAGGATSAAGRIVVQNGILKAVWPHSGHYRPTKENFQDFILFLRDDNIDLTDVKMDRIEDEDESVGKTSSVHLRSNSSEDDLAGKDVQDCTPGNIHQREGRCATLEPCIMSCPFSNNNVSPEGLKSESQATGSSHTQFQLELSDGYETPEESFDQRVPEQNLYEEKSILQRINSRKETKSCQFGKHLSYQWSTGAGPRIGYLRDYPSELQFHALEQVNLSPRSACSFRSNFSPLVSAPSSFKREKQVGDDSPPAVENQSISHRSNSHLATQLSPLFQDFLVTSTDKRL